MFTVKNDKPRPADFSDAATRQNAMHALRPMTEVPAPSASEWSPSSSPYSPAQPPRASTSAPKPETVAVAVGSVIGQGLSIRGALVSNGELTIDGLVDGDVQAKRVSVGPTGRVTGQIVGETVEVLGVVQGSVRAQLAMLRACGRIEGDVVHDVLVVEQGASFEGAAIRSSSTAVKDKLV